MRRAIVLAFALAAVQVAFAAPQESGLEAAFEQTLRENVLIEELGSKSQCQVLHNVCLDQETVVSYDAAYNPVSPDHKPLPDFNVGDLRYTYVAADTLQIGDRFDAEDNMRPRLLPYFGPYLRANGGMEPTDDLRRPVFSAEETPVVFWTNWLYNHFEFITHTMSRAHKLSAAGLDNLTYVIGTPGGQGLNSYHSGLLQPFTKQPISSLADFSARNRIGRRCFERTVLCKWFWGTYEGVYDAMQSVYEHYNPAVFKDESSRDKSVLHVLVESREGPIRTLVNARDLVEACNNANWKLPEGSPYTRVECAGPVAFTSDMETNMRLVREADVLVCIHGSGCANTMYMREGSTMLEIRPYQFGSGEGESMEWTKGWADNFFPPLLAAQDWKIRWFGINIDDTAAFRPTDLEVSGIGHLFGWVRDRHTILRFEAFQEMVLRIAEGSASMKRYVEQRNAGMHYVRLSPDGLDPIPQPSELPETSAVPRSERKLKEVRLDSFPSSFNARTFFELAGVGTCADLFAGTLDTLIQGKVAVAAGVGFSDVSLLCAPKTSPKRMLLAIQQGNLIITPIISTTSPAAAAVALASLSKAVSTGSLAKTITVVLPKGASIVGKISQPCIIDARGKCIPKPITGEVAGDPHCTGFNGKKFDYHNEGLTTLVATGAGESLISNLVPINKGITLAKSARFTYNKQTGEVKIVGKGTVVVTLNGKPVATGTTSKAMGLTVIATSKMGGGVFLSPRLQVVVSYRYMDKRPDYGAWLNIKVVVAKPLTSPVSGILGTSYKAPKAGLFSAASLPSATIGI